MKQIWNKENIQEYINNNNQNCEVLDIERRKNSILYVYLKCKKCNAKFYKLWDTIKNGKHICPECSKNEKNIFNFSEHENYLHSNFPQYKLLDIKREKGKTYYKVECEHGHVYWGYRNHLHNGHGCKFCRHKVIKFWSKDKILELYKKFNLKIINLDEYCNCESILYAKTKEGYIIRTIPYKLKKFGIRDPYLYNRCNKYAKYNLDNWCKLNRPDYECINFTQKGKRSKCIFLYKGDFINDNVDRRFECSLEDFIKSGVEHPFLNMSFGERTVFSFLKDNGFNFKTQYKFLGCYYKNKNVPLRFDFYLPDYNICIEYNGEQHYKPIERFGGTNGFKEQQIRDNIKRQYCKDNGIKLIEIAYDENLKISMDNILKVVNNNVNIRSN